MITLWGVMIINALGWLLPVPADKLGWGLRIRPLENHQPYLAMESIEQARLAIVLINKSKEERKYLLLDAACANGDLETTIVRPNGKPLRNHSHPSLAILFEYRWKLPAGQLVAEQFKSGDLGYYELPEPGEYELRASLKTAQGIVTSPPVKLAVVEPAPDAILASIAVPLEGYQAKWPKEKQETAAMQQIKLGNRTWLFYRQFLSSELGGKVSHSFRLAELPGKVELRVEGAFGDRNPLTIIYKDTKSPTGEIKLVINSINGMPWSAEEERLRQERLIRAKGSNPAGARFS